MIKRGEEGRAIPAQARILTWGAVVLAPVGGGHFRNKGLLLATIALRESTTAPTLIPRQ